MRMIIDSLKNVLAKIVNEKVSDVLLEEKVARKIEKYIKKISKNYNEAKFFNQYECESLFEYYRNSFTNDVISYLSEPSPKERKTIRSSIINKAIDLSAAENSDSISQVTKLTSDLLKLISEFYKKNNSLFRKTDLANHIEENIEKSIRTNTTTTQELIKENHNQIASIIKSNNCLSIDKGIDNIKNNRIDEIKDSLNSYINSLSTSYSYYPDYKITTFFDGERIRLKSVATSEESLIKLPPKIKCEAELCLSKEQKDRIDTDIFQYAYRNQESINIVIKNAEKYLGKFKDQIQDEADLLIGKTLQITPPSFPDPTPCSLIIDNTTQIDYLLLGIERIIDDDIMLISNIKQEHALAYIGFVVNLNDDKTSDLEFKINRITNCNKQILQYEEVLKAINDGTELKIKSLKENKIIVECNIENFKFESGFLSIEEEIDFTKKIIYIEEYFKRGIHVPDDIESSDYNNVCFLYDLLNGKVLNGTWSSFSAKGTLNKSVINKKIDKPMPMSITCNTTRDFMIFGEKFEVITSFEFEEAVFDNLEKLKNKLKYADDDDIITFKFVPSENNNRYKERIKNN